MKLQTLSRFGVFSLVALGLAGCDLKRDSGLWRGTVMVREDLRAPYTCEMEVEISHTEETVILHHLASTCMAYAMKWHVGGFEVHGSSLWRNGSRVGWAHEDGSVGMELGEHQADQRYPLPAHRVSLNWQRVGEGLEFSEEVQFAGERRRASGWLRRVR